jgi:hypothetical protein
MSRVIDDRGRLFGKVNVVDILVLAVIVALAVFVGLRFSGTDAVSTGESKPVTVTFMVQPAYEGMLDAYEVLGELRDKEGRYLGMIEKTEVGERNRVDVSGRDWAFTLDFAAPPVVTIYVSAQGNVSGDTVRIGSLAARVGAVVQLVGPGWEGEARILKVVQGEAVGE